MLAIAALDLLPLLEHRDITLSLQIHLSGTLFRLGLDDAEDAQYGHMLLNNSMDKYG